MIIDQDTPLIDPGVTQHNASPLVTFPHEGTYQITAAVEFRGGGSNQIVPVHFTQVVVDPNRVLNDHFKDNSSEDYGDFRSTLAKTEVMSSYNGRPDSPANHAVNEAYIDPSSGGNPATFAPDSTPGFSYKFHPGPTPPGVTYRWHIRPQGTKRLQLRGYHNGGAATSAARADFSATSAGGVTEYQIPDSPSVDLNLYLNPQWEDGTVFTVTCEQIAAGDPTTSAAKGAILARASFLQVVLSPANKHSVDRLRVELKQIDQASDVIPEGLKVPVRATYLNRATGDSKPLTLYIGHGRRAQSDPTAANAREDRPAAVSADPHSKVWLVDLTPDLPPSAPRQYGPAYNSRDAITAFGNDNHYPAGIIRYEIPPNLLGIEPQASPADQPLLVKGNADVGETAGTWANVLNITAVLLSATGVGLAVAVPVLFAGAAVLGTLAAGRDIQLMVPEDAVDPVGMTIDLLNIASGLLTLGPFVREGAAGFKVLEEAVGQRGVSGLVDSRAAAEAARLKAWQSPFHEFVYVAGVNAGTGAGMLLAAQSFAKLVAILTDPNMKDHERITAVVTFLYQAAQTGAIVIPVARDAIKMQDEVNAAAAPNTAGGHPAAPGSPASGHAPQAPGAVHPALAPDPATAAAGATHATPTHDTHEPIPATSAPPQHTLPAGTTPAHPDAATRQNGAPVREATGLVGPGGGQQGFKLGKWAKKFTYADGEIHASEQSRASDPAALAQQEQLAERQALAALTAAERTNVGKVLVGKQADAFVKAKSGKDVYIDVVAVTKENKYLLTQAMDRSIYDALLQLQRAGEALGHQQVTAYTVTLPRQFMDRTYSVENGIIYRKQGDQKTPYLIYNKPVQVVYAQGQGVIEHSSP